MDSANPGDIVALASGGPDLTILRVHDGDADFGWFTATGEYRTGTLPLAVLRERGGSVGSGGESHAAMTTCCGKRIMVWLCPSCDVRYAVETATLNPHSCGQPEYRRPPRTGYRDDRGIYHPGPDALGYEEHANGCTSCAAERATAPDAPLHLRRAARR